MGNPLDPIIAPNYSLPPVTEGRCSYHVRYWADIRYEGDGWHSRGQTYSQWMSRNRPPGDGLPHVQREVFRSPSNGFDTVFHGGYQKSLTSSGYAVKVLNYFFGGSVVIYDFITDKEEDSISVSYRVQLLRPYPSSCPPILFLRSPEKPEIHLGTASPPPPSPRNMCGCDCNTIASIIAEQMAEKQRLLDAIKEHVDVRTLEQLNHINKMLQDIDMDLDLQPVIDEIKRAEANLWNGISGGG